MGICKDEAETSHEPFTQVPPVVTLDITVTQNQDYQADTGRMLVCGFMPFYHTHKFIQPSLQPSNRTILSTKAVLMFPLSQGICPPALTIPEPW